MKKHTVYRFDHMPANFNKLAQAVWWYFDGSHNLMEVDGKLVFTDFSEEEINSGERDLDTITDMGDWHEFDSLCSFEIWCLKLFAEHLDRTIKAGEEGEPPYDDFDHILKQIEIHPAR